MKQDLPIFPKFEKLSLGHKDLLQAIANNFPSSDFNFAGLFTWDIDDSVSVSSLNDNLVICSADYLTHERFYSFIGNHKIDETIRSLMDFAKQNGESPTLRLIPETVAQNIQQTTEYSVNEDRDNHDYIYAVSDWAQLKDGKFANKRRVLNKFLREHGGAVTEKELDLTDTQVQRDIESVVTRWAESRGKQPDDVADELIAIKKALEHHRVLSLRAFGVYHDSQLIAFTIFEVLPGEVAIGHFEKADAHFEGVFVYLKHVHAKYLAGAGVRFINTEQDLGIEGQRKSKESLHPAAYIKKYTIERK